VLLLVVIIIEESLANNFIIKNSRTYTVLEAEKVFNKLKPF
jgi:hypothetical protein